MECKRNLESNKNRKISNQHYLNPIEVDLLVFIAANRRVKTREVL